MKSWRQRYYQHLKSPYWRELKLKVIARRGFACERCRLDCVTLDLHHKHYRTLGRERQRDVSLLCRPCHIEEDKRRAIEGRISSALCRVDRGIESDADITVLAQTVWKG